MTDQINHFLTQSCKVARTQNLLFVSLRLSVDSILYSPIKKRFIEILKGIIEKYLIHKKLSENIRENRAGSPVHQKEIRDVAFAVKVCACRVKDLSGEVCF